MANTPHRFHTSRQQGVTLIVTLLMLVVVTLLALSTSRLASQEEVMSRALRSRNIAFENASSALAEGRKEIMDYRTDDRSTLRNFFLAPLQIGPKLDSGANCSTPELRGICHVEPLASVQHSWQINMATQGIPRGLFARFGAIPGNPMPAIPVGAGLPAPPAPRYLIEYCPSAIGRPGVPQQSCANGSLFRITAQGFGPGGAPNVWLQQTIRPNEAWEKEADAKRK